MKRVLLIALSYLFAMLSTAALANELQAGKHFTPINPPQTPLASGKIEVIEFFSYGCPHCNDFHPQISEWAAKLPKDVSFRRVPITFNRPAWARLAKIFYALEATGDLARLDGEVFKAIHEQRINFATDESVVQWAVAKGIDGKKFTDAMNSFSINSLITRGDQESAAHRIQGVPAIAIEGRFLMSSAENHTELLKNTDIMINKARNEKRKK